MATANPLADPTDPPPAYGALPAYPFEGPDQVPGEAGIGSRFRYLPGHPRQIRFDAKAGVFNIGGQQVIGKTISFIPLAFRVFTDDILRLGRKRWAELFYVDETGAVCALLLHGYSVENLIQVNATLFYDDLTLAEVELTITAGPKENKKVGGVYFVAEFSYREAPAAAVSARRAFAREHFIYREATVTGAAEMALAHAYRLPRHYESPRAAVAG
jgi:hypothetical protein